MARKLSRIAQHGCCILVAVSWLPLGAATLADGDVHVAPAAKVIANPYVVPSAARPLVPPMPALPENGPRMYQNPFAAQAPSPPVIMPPGPGPISRWQRSVQQPGGMVQGDAVLPIDPIQCVRQPSGVEPVAAELPGQPANPFAGVDAEGDAAFGMPPEPRGFVPQSVCQPPWLLPDDRPGALSDGPAALLGATRRDPFDDGGPVDLEPDSGVRFVPPSRDAVKSAALQRAFDLDRPQTTAAENPLGEPPDWLARAEKTARVADTADEMSAVVALCQQGLAGNVPRDQRQSLRQLAAWALNRRGELASDAGRDQVAMDDFQAAVELDPECWLALHNRGVSFAQHGRGTEALRDFNRALGLNPGLAVAYRNRGELLASLDRTEEAVHDYSQAISQLPDDAELYVMRGHAWHRLGEYGQALADLNRSIELAPDRPDAYTHRGNVHAEQGDFEAAVDDFQQAIQLNPDWADAYRSLAWLLATCPDPQWRDPQQALAAARRAAKLARPDDCFVLDALAAAHASAGQFAEAVRCQQQAVAAAPDDFAPALHERLELYERREAYRNSAASAVRTADYEDSSRRPANQRPR